jgi:hypothetical protein
MKYIIEFEDEPIAEDSLGQRYYQTVSGSHFRLREDKVEELTPYTDDGKDKLWSAFQDALGWNTDNRMAAFGYCNTADWFDVFDPDSFIKMVDEYNKLIKREDDMNELVTETLRMAEEQNFSLEAVIVALMNVKKGEGIQ